jgi:hypothetical protein
MMERLIRESWRWHSVQFWMWSAPPAFNLWRLTLDLPNLSSLALKVHDVGGWVIPMCLDAFRNAPMLRKFVLEDESILTKRIRILLPWHQLETIECPFSPDYSPARLISSCPSLKSAHLTYSAECLTVNPSSNAGVIYEPLTTSLDTLVLECWHSVDRFCSRLERCLSQLQLDSLRSLEIYSRYPSSFLAHSESFINLVS